MTREQWMLYKEGKYEMTEDDTPTDAGAPFKAKDENGVEKEYQIRVFAKDGHIPHFHVMNDEGFDSEICIYEAKYHEGSKDKLSDDLVEKVIKVISDGCNGYPADQFTGWDFVETAFIGGQYEERDENFEFDFHVQTTCPNYSKLKEEK